MDGIISENRVGASIKRRQSFKQIGNRKIEVCPKCESIFITGHECESCGLQFRVDKLGEPFGARSFYAIRDSYISNFPIYLKLMNANLENKKGKSARKYRHLLIHRFEVLADHFRLNEEMQSDFEIELRDLISELREYGVQESFFLDDRLGEVPCWFQMAISETLNEFCRKNKLRNEIPDFTSYLKYFQESWYYPIWKWLFIYSLIVGAFALNFMERFSS